MFICSLLIITGDGHQEEKIMVKNKTQSHNASISNVDYQPKTIIQGPHLQSQPQPKSRQGQWQLIWNDEFQNGASFKDWNLQDWPSNKNGEWQYYTPENVKVRAGNLVIESKRERFKGREYTSGALTTENKLEFTYGKIDIRAKLPKGQGVFPAFWLVNSMNGTWLPEIDMMENLGNAPNELYFVVHWQDANGTKKRDFTHFISKDVDYSKDFHLYSLIWEKDRIIWLVDHQIVFQTKHFSPSTPLFLYLNTAIGGNWPGPPSSSDQYPKELLIDYVRVYQKHDGSGQ
ncbi:glycoside hydrolase family 16 protein [Fictibacillus nanhaiensis]|uniref:glycoside hydrolase family 16 protein n=1 Tax=Fictibacillus nanhaiensis TaxID=742169 RepID=UPI003C1A32B1